MHGRHHLSGWMSLLLVPLPPGHSWPPPGSAPSSSSLDPSAPQDPRPNPVGPPLASAAHDHKYSQCEMISKRPRHNMDDSQADPFEEGDCDDNSHR